MRVIKSTNRSSGLAKFVSKLAEERERLFAVHDRALQLCGLTLGISCSRNSGKLLRVDYDTATVRSNDTKPPAAPERLKYHVASADKVGGWFRAFLPIKSFRSYRSNPDAFPGP